MMIIMDIFTKNISQVSWEVLSDDQREISSYSGQCPQCPRKHSLECHQSLGQAHPHPFQPHLPFHSPQESDPQ